MGHQLLELLAGTLAALIRMMQQSVRLVTSPDSHDERIGNKLGRHPRFYRPARDAASEGIMTAAT